MWLIGNNKKTLDSNPIQDDDCYAQTWINERGLGALAIETSLS